MSAPGQSRRRSAAGDAPVSLLGDRWLWIPAIVCAVAGAVYGTAFAPTIGEPAAAGAVGLGLMGLAFGLVVGVVIAWFRRRSRAEDALRQRFVDHLNASSPQDSHYSISPTDRRALVVTFTREASREMTEAVLARARSRLEAAADENFQAMAGELKRNGFRTWIFQINGEAVLERTVP